MRRKNRQFKVTVDVPESCESDEDFAYTLQDIMDKNDWHLTVLNPDGEEMRVPVSKINYADFELEQED